MLPPDTTLVLTYRVTPTDVAGAPSVDEIRYTGADGRTGVLGPVSLPWTLQVRTSRLQDRLYTLESQLNAAGDVTGMIAQIVADGEPVSLGTVPGQPGGLRAVRTARAAHRHRP